MGTINMCKVFLVTFPKTDFFHLSSFVSASFLFPFSTFLSNPSVTFFITHVSALLPPGRTGQPVSHPGPPVPDFAERHLGFVSSRQPGAAGTVGTEQTFSGKIRRAALHVAIPEVALMSAGLFLHQLMFSRPYSRRLEAEADQVGLQLAAKVSLFQSHTG